MTDQERQCVRENLATFGIPLVVEELEEKVRIAHGPDRYMGYQDVVFLLRDQLAERTVKLESLVAHCWVHSGYPDCGRKQMDSEMQTLYDAVIARETKKDATNEEVHDG